jgi:hypothetical protein
MTPSITGQTALKLAIRLYDANNHQSCEAKHDSKRMQYCLKIAQLEQINNE